MRSSATITMYDVSCVTLATQTFHSWPLMVVSTIQIPKLTRKLLVVS